MWMQGGTRAAEQFLVVTIHYELDGVVGPNNKPLRVSVDEAKSLWFFEKLV
jgi:hypothetical protein